MFFRQEGFSVQGRTAYSAAFRPILKDETAVVFGRKAPCLQRGRKAGTARCSDSLKELFQSSGGREKLAPPPPPPHPIVPSLMDNLVYLRAQFGVSSDLTIRELEAGGCSAALVTLEAWWTGIHCGCRAAAHEPGAGDWRSRRADGASGTRCWPSPMLRVTTMGADRPGLPRVCRRAGGPPGVPNTELRGSQDTRVWTRLCSEMDRLGFPGGVYRRRSVSTLSMIRRSG